MAYDEKLAERIRRQLKNKRGLTEKKMFGGICFMIRGNMACGVINNELVVRTGQEKYFQALRNSYTRPMDFTGRPLKGFVYVSSQGCMSAAGLKKWIGLGIGFAGSLPSKIK